MYSPDVHCPTPVRHLKHALADLVSDSEPASKRTRLSPIPLPTPPSSIQVEHPQQSNPLCDPSDWRQRLKSSLLRPLDNQHRPPTKQPTATSKVSAWLNAVPYLRSDSCSASPHTYSPPSYSPLSEHVKLERPQSCPAHFDLVGPKRPASGSFAPDSIEPKRKRARLTLATVQEMSQPQSQYAESQGPGSYASQNGRPGTSHPMYRGTLYHNYITLDYSGRKMPEELRTFASTKILKQRGSPQLGDEAVSKVIDTVEELADSTEGPTAKLIRTDMFPFELPGIAEGGNSPWSTVALPNNPEHQYDLSAPKPDTHFGYPTNQRSGWSNAQTNVITHPVARPYAQPARGNTFPFLMVEMKSEAAGGTIYVAENQAAGSGSHSVNALLWLLQEGGTYNSSSVTDTIAFTITMSHREAIFYLHWYSEPDRRYYMSFLESYSSVKAKDIRACNNTVKNIIDQGLGARRTAISTALEALFPFPQHWKQARPPSTTPSTSATSFTEEARPNKKKRAEGSRR